MNRSMLGRLAAGLSAALLLAMSLVGLTLVGSASAAPGGQSEPHRAAAADGQDAAAASESADHSDGNASTEGDSTEPQPASNADFSGNGANVHGPYDSTRDGSAAENGVGDGKALGKPCAGCVGKADNKNPNGQLPGGSDPNAGYECDRNQGVGKTNPAHTGCKEQPPGNGGPPPGNGGPPPGERPPGERPGLPPGEAPSEALPKTGADPLQPLGVAAGLLLTGTGLIALSARRAS